MAYSTGVRISSVSIWIFTAFKRSSVFRLSRWILQLNLSSRFYLYKLIQIFTSLIIILRNPFFILRNWINFRQFLCLVVFPQVLIYILICIFAVILTTCNWSLVLVCMFIYTWRTVDRSKIRRLIISHTFRWLLIDRTGAQTTIVSLSLESKFHWWLFAFFDQLSFFHLLVNLWFFSDNFRLVYMSSLLFFVWKWPWSTWDTLWISWKPLEALINCFSHH